MNQTICAISTAPGVGGIAVIRVSGPDAVVCVDKVFRSLKAGHALSARSSHTLTYGQIVSHSSQGFSPESPIDDVVLALYRAPNSYTGEDVVEISCHGSLYIQQQILDLLTSQDGVRLAEPGEFTRRAFANARLDLTQAEAVADLIASRNAAAHRMAMNQMRGGISLKLAELHDKLLNISSLLELELDFSEEDVEFADRSQLHGLATDIDAEVVRLMDSFQMGQAIKEGIPVAIIGAPNVGKSTLLNTLLGDDKAIVSPIEGTTRDVIEDTMVIAGRMFRFIDTAGIRHLATNGDDQQLIESMGIERSLKAASRARIIIMMSEPGVPYPEVEVQEGQHVIRIENKTEHFSAKSGVGVDALKQQLVDLATMPELAQGDVILSNKRHYDALAVAHRHIVDLLAGMDNGISGDLLAEDLRGAIEALNSILGKAITSQDTLNNIFAHFCIGK